MKEALVAVDAIEFSPDFANVIGAQKGEIVGERFEIIEGIALGGLAGVVKGRDVNDPKKFVAIKFPRQDRYLTRCLIRMEHEALKDLQGIDGLMPLIDAGRHNSNPYLAFEFAERTLRARPQLETTEEVLSAWNDLVVVADSLEQVHARGWYHGDVKPQNVLVKEKPYRKLYVADLGSAAVVGSAVKPHKLTESYRAKRALKWTKADDPKLPINGKYLTPRYSPIERLPTYRRGYGRPTQEGDVFAWGVMALEMLTGKSAWVESGSGARRINLDVGYENDLLPRHIVELVHECLSNYAEARPSFYEVTSAAQRMNKYPNQLLAVRRKGKDPNQLLAA
jgi:serine/threonine protein kinase